MWESKINQILNFLFCFFHSHEGRADVVSRRDAGSRAPSATEGGSVLHQRGHQTGAEHPPHPSGCFHPEGEMSVLAEAGVRVEFTDSKLRYYVDAELFKLHGFISQAKVSVLRDCSLFLDEEMYVIRCFYFPFVNQK